jgi:hypothetical protein
MIVIVLGMHRSGTSALAGTLHHNNISMGDEKDFFPPPMKENPKGFYENNVFRQLNDKILEYNNYKVKSFDPYTIPNFNLDVSDDSWKKMVHAITYYSLNYVNWGFKDPRNCITLWPWIRCFRYLNKGDSIKIILCYRNPEEVRKSMLRRGNKENLHEKQFKVLANKYYDVAISSLIMADIPFLAVQFDKMINNPVDTFRDVSNYLEYDIKDLSFIDKSISKGK